jgi:hypothetical protein
MLKCRAVILYSQIVFGNLESNKAISPLSCRPYIPHTFKNTKAKTEKEREVKNASKIKKAKQVFLDKIYDFRRLNNTGLGNMLNWGKEVLIQ